MQNDRGWVEKLESGFDAGASAWGLFGRHAYVYERALEVMRGLSSGQVRVLMDRCRNEAERYALHVAMRGGPAQHFAEDWLLNHSCEGDPEALGALLRFWDGKLPGTLVRFDPVAGEFTYPESCRRMDHVTYRRRVDADGYWVGEPLRTPRRTLEGFAQIVDR